MVLVGSIVAAACTNDGGTLTTTTTTPATDPDGATPGSLIDAAFGTQAVQDFVIHIDLALQTDEGQESFYAEVLEEAASGAEAPTELAGGFTLSPVESLTGHVVDSEGDPLPSVSLDFGLFGLTAEAFDDIRAKALSDATGSGDESLVEILQSMPSAGNALLLELVTADPSSRHTHLSPGDRTGFDLGFVDELEVGDPLMSVAIFGQTIPGVPQRELGMTPYELFAYRWNVGLMRILGDEGATVVVDESLTVVEGSELLSRDMKQTLLDEAFRTGADAAFDETVEKLDDMIDDPRYVATDPARGSKMLCIDIDLPGEFVHVVAEDYLAAAMMFGGLEACFALAVELNRRNAEGGIKVDEIDQGGREEGDLPLDLFGDEPAADVPPGGVSCFEPEPPEPPMTGTTFGDVHVATFDALGYDNQSVGEFWVFDNGTVQVQMRLEPVEGSQGASIVTAAAVGVGGHTVSMHPIGETWIDGAETALERGRPFDLGAAELLRSPGHWTIVTADGTVVEVSDIVALTTDALIVTIRPSAVPSVGMFGSADGNPDNDLVTRDGIQLEAHTRFDTEFFHASFVDSWRITEEESLFHYGPGESADNFLIEGFPQSWLTVADLPELERTKAERLCGEVGVTREDLLAACVFDVVVTGDPAFAYQSFLVQATTPGRAVVSGDGGSVVTVGDLTLDMDDPVATWECAVAEGTFFAQGGLRYGDDLYELALEYYEPATSETGDERLTMTVFLNGTPHAWMLSWLDVPTGTFEDLAFDGSTLTATGTAYLNDPPDPTLTLFAPIPAGAPLQAFSVRATCDH